MHHLGRSCCALLAVLTFWLVLSVSQIASAQTCTPPPPGMTAWYPADGNANDIQNGNNGTLQNGATFAAGKVNEAFSFDGVDDAVAVPNSATLELTGNQITIDA